MEFTKKTWCPIIQYALKYMDSSKKRVNFCPRNGISSQAPKFNGYISLSRKEQSQFLSKNETSLCNFSSPLSAVCVWWLETQPKRLASQKKSLNAVQITDTVRLLLAKNHIKNNRRPSVDRVDVADVCKCWALTCLTFFDISLWHSGTNTTDWACNWNIY